MSSCCGPPLVLRAASLSCCARFSRVVIRACVCRSRDSAPASSIVAQNAMAVNRIVFIGFMVRLLSFDAARLALARGAPSLRCKRRLDAEGPREQENWAGALEDGSGRPARWAALAGGTRPAHGDMQGRPSRHVLRRGERRQIGGPGNHPAARPHAANRVARWTPLRTAGYRAKLLRYQRWS